MASEHLGPAHPCLGCQHRGKTLAVKARKNLPGNICQHNHGRGGPICWGDPLPTWCPGKVTK